MGQLGGTVFWFGPHVGTTIGITENRDRIRDPDGASAIRSCT